MQTQLWGVLVEVIEGSALHLVQPNGRVTCKCTLIPGRVMLVESQKLDKGILKNLCEGSRKHLDVSK
jgi:hypothetical protein